MPSELFLRHYAEKANSPHPGVQTGRGAQFDPRTMSQVAAEAIRLLDLEPSHRFLDVGCANGLFDPIFASIVREVVAIEPVTQLAELARANLADTDSASVLQAHVGDLPLHDGVVDRILMLEVIQLIPEDEIPRAISELERVLVAGGRVLVGSIPDACSRDSFLEAYLDSVKDAEHLSDAQKDAIIERNLESTWYDREDLSEKFRGAGFSCEILDPAPLTGRQGDRFHILAHSPR